MIRNESARPQRPGSLTAKRATPSSGRRRDGRIWKALLVLAAAWLAAPPARASIFEGETLDKVANVLAWVVLVIAPIIGIVVFWLVHILPEKIAEKKHHPQTKAIQTLCLLSLFFGGMLWPIAWLWAYSKPVLYKLAYGRDVEPHEPGKPEEAPEVPSADAEVVKLKQKIAALEEQLALRVAREGGA